MAEPVVVLLARAGGGNVASGMDGFRGFSRELCDRCSGGDEPLLLLPGPPPPSKDCALFPTASPPLACGSAENDAKCCDSIDRFSSIGVNILCDLRCGNFLMAESVFSMGICGRSEPSVLGSTGGGG
jgi:hypothetical protein